MEKPPPYSPPNGGDNSYNSSVPPYPTGAPYQPSPYPPGNQQPSGNPYPPNPYQPPVVTQPAYQEIHFYPPQENTVIIANGPIVPRPLGPHSQLVSCPVCHHTIATRVELKASTTTHIWAMILCLFGCWPCCFIPYCMDSCQSRHHHCVRCGAFLGVYSD